MVTRVLPLVLLMILAGCSPEPSPARPRPGLSWTAIAPLPQPRANLALAGGRSSGQVYAFLGLDESKAWTGIRRDAFAYDPSTGGWNPLPDVPGDEGRLAGAALELGGRIHVFGGYTVDAGGHEVSVEQVDVFDPATRRWGRSAPMPTPVDDSVVLGWKERYAILVSGWSQDGNVDLVQVFDAVEARWYESTPIPGRPVFGHAGALVGDTIVYCDGVRVEDDPPPGHSRFFMERSCWEGTIAASDASRIAWRRLPDHPGKARYRMAAGDLGDLAIFVGGSATAYNYDGIGYEGDPAQPEAGVFAWSTSEERWIDLGPAPAPTMDHRALAGLDGSLYLVGGMGESQRVLDSAFRLELAR